ncbi:MAG: SEC-C metal-binding domain-containing protein [Verrucomicrobiota bacterium]
MKPKETSGRVLTAEEVSFTGEAQSIQRSALAGQGRVVQLGQIVFFSTETGDAWMLDTADGRAVCVARDFERRPIPILETADKLTIEWNVDYQIGGEAFTVTEPNGAPRTILGYPTEEIQRVVREYSASSGQDALSEADAAREQLKTGRNERCPCGSGRKYKKCCLANDEAIVRRATLAQPMETIQPAESVLPWNKNTPEADFETTEEPWENDVVNEPAWPPEVENKLNELWAAYEALKQPTAEQMDEFLGNLLVLPPEAASWSDLFHRFARQNHSDLPTVFRRIAGSVSHTKGAGLAFFYWAAAKEFVGRGLSQMRPEVAAGFAKLDLHSYDPDALGHFEDYLLAGHFEAETLQLCEHFLPIMRADDGLMPYAVPDQCNLIFELRVGRSLRAEKATETSPDSLAETLRRGIEEEIHADSARHAAAIAFNQSPCPARTRAQFELVTGDICTNDRAWQECLRLYETLICVAREACHTEGFAPGCAFRGLSLLLKSVYASGAEKRTKEKKKANNLLDYLRPAGMEERLARACCDIIGVNEPRARLMLDAHEILLGYAMRHQLISTSDAALTEKELGRLRSILGDTAAK